ncbi:DUF2062 domain-containing protein [Paenibacillus humicus]|uniref:DUF2062 domain-containing protein n=1 Tax=Paenibacillus humicus TaxID=412861 RepID=UPI003F18E92A
MRLKRWKRNLTYHGIRLLRQRQGSHRISLGAVLGLLPCWYPTFGIGLALSLGLIRLFRGNAVSGMLAASVGTFLWPILFYANYLTGQLSRELFARPAEPELAELLSEPAADISYEETADSLGALSGIGVDFLIGSVLNSIVVSAAMYGVLRILWTRYRLPLLMGVRARAAGARAVMAES